MIFNRHYKILKSNHFLKQLCLLIYPFGDLKDNWELKKYKSSLFRLQRHTRMNKKVYLCSPIIGERLRIPVDWGVNSGVFGRAQWFVNRQSSKGIARFQRIR